MKLATNYNAYVQDESKKTAEELVVDRVGKQDPKRHLESSVTDLMTSNIDQCLGTMLDTVVFELVLRINRLLRVTTQPLFCAYLNCPHRLYRVILLTRGIFYTSIF